MSCGLHRVSHFESCGIHRNHQCSVCLKQSRKNSWLHLRKRLSIPERLGTALICLRLDVLLLHNYDELVVSSARRSTVDSGDARLTRAASTGQRNTCAKFTARVLEAT